MLGAPACAAKLATLASRAPLGQSPRVRETKRASRADPEAALLGAADIAPPRPGPRAWRPPMPPGADRPANAARRHPPLWQRHGCPSGGRDPCARIPPRCRQRRGPSAVGAPCAQPRSAAAPAARAARIVQHSRGDCPSGARAASVASFAAPAGAASIAGHPREAGASTRRARGEWPAPSPAPLPAQTFARARRRLKIAGRSPRRARRTRRPSAACPARAPAARRCPGARRSRAPPA